MLIEHFGKAVDLDPLRAAVEISIVAALQRRGPLRQRDLYYRAAGSRIGQGAFREAVDSLVNNGQIVRTATHRKDSFILRVAKDQRRSERAAAKRNAVARIGGSFMPSSVQATKGEKQ